MAVVELIFVNGNSKSNLKYSSTKVEVVTAGFSRFFEVTLSLMLTSTIDLIQHIMSSMAS
jgi:hypothetical protein